MSARKSTSKKLGGFDFWKEDSDEQSTGSSSEVYRLKIEAETYKSKYKDVRDENDKLKVEIQMLRERLGIIAATTNLLMPISSIIPTAEQMTKNSFPKFKRSPTPPSTMPEYSMKKAIPSYSKSPTPPPSKIEKEEKPEPKYKHLEISQPRVMLEEVKVPKRLRGRPPGATNKKNRVLSPEPEPRSSNCPPSSITDETPIFRLDPKYPQMTQSFLRRCHEMAEFKVYVPGGRAPEHEFRDRIFVRLIFNSIFEVDELIGRCAVGRIKRHGKPWGGPEIDPGKKKFIKEKLKERLDVIDPENSNERLKQPLLNRWFAVLLKNRISTTQNKLNVKNSQMDNSNAASTDNDYSMMNDDTIFEISDEPIDDDDEDNDEEIYGTDIEVEIFPKLEKY